MVFSGSIQVLSWYNKSVPKIFEWNGYKFFFFSNEGIPREPCHVHVRKGEKTAKFWIEPGISVAYNFEMTGKELKDLQDVVEKNIELIRSKWNEYFEH